MPGDIVNLKDACREHPKVSYQRINRAALALEKEGMITLTRGTNNELLFSKDDGRFLSRLLLQLEKGYDAAIGIARLRAELAQEQVEELQLQVEELQGEVQRLKKSS